MLKFFELEARFPRTAAELPPAAVQYVAEQVDVDVAQLSRYDWSGRSIKYHRAQIREALGFREVRSPTRCLPRHAARLCEQRPSVAAGWSRRGRLL